MKNKDKPICVMCKKPYEWMNGGPFKCHACTIKNEPLIDEKILEDMENFVTSIKVSHRNNGQLAKLTENILRAQWKEIFRLAKIGIKHEKPTITRKRKAI